MNIRLGWIFLLLLSIIAFVAGCGMLDKHASGAGVFGEVKACILFLISAVFLSGSVIVEAVSRIQMDISIDDYSPRGGKRYYYLADGKNKIGPFSLSELRTLEEAGKLHPTDMILLQGAGKWVSADSINGLFL